MKKVIATTTVLVMSLMIGSSVVSAASLKKEPKGYGGHVEEKEEKKENKKDEKKENKKLKDRLKSWFDSIRNR
jgi:ribosomal protein L12E/L44/L45/RPP1/RPP2